jgi:hypothetical protein
MSSRDKNVSKKAPSTKKDEAASYEKHPFFIKKTAAAKKTLSKVGLPKQFNNRAHV